MISIKFYEFNSHTPNPHISKNYFPSGFCLVVHGLQAVPVIITVSRQPHSIFRAAQTAVILPLAKFRSTFLEALIHLKTQNAHVMPLNMI